MTIDNRQLPRFRDFARARIDSVCQLPGFLEDVSKTGCKVRFTNTFTIEHDREYTLTIVPPFRCGIKEFDVTVQPEWIRSRGEYTEIGFSIFHCPGIRQYSNYVEHLADLDETVVQEA